MCRRTRRSTITCGSASFSTSWPTSRDCAGLRQRPRWTPRSERLDLTRVMPLLTGKLSRGFRQRVSIAQALLGNSADAGAGRADQRARSVPGYRLSRSHPLARGKPHRADRITRPPRDRKDRLPDHDPARRRASDRRCAEGNIGRDNVAACGGRSGSGRPRRRLRRRRRARHRRRTGLRLGNDALPDQGRAASPSVAAGHRRGAGRSRRRRLAS